ncbi:hypothetical protein [Nonomuraea gerenzanensis]|uniref:Integral membrane protein n=1 Tax=Nonomuraea gerenzanensis TaxID=93944 RepID=A0A1M4DVV5_9ACTN|nr:hypothetical protein [Nonomuraea gerenzanensis]UBU13050.1 hypothetical protein LCN96_53905 [Nonomuraea gerenzanensis]SBO90692.1 hypothetical protein BN4615_P206 [Nonomuraea gerenzanensis]
MNSRIAFIAAPLLTFAYGVIRIIDGLDGSRGPGLAWTAGHLAFMAALVLFAQIFWQLRAMAGRGTLSTVTAVAGTAGIATLLAQFGIDLVVGFMAADHDGMGVLFDQVQSVPGVSIVVYDGGPFLFYLAQLGIVLQLAVMRRVKAWMPVLVLLDLALPFMDKDLIPLGALCLLVSFVPLARRAPARHAVAVA